MSDLLGGEGGDHAGENNREIWGGGRRQADAMRTGTPSSAAL